MTNELAKTENRTQIANYNNSWEQVASHLQKFIPIELPRDKIKEQAFFLIRRTPMLLECSLESFAASLLRAHSLKLDPLLPNVCWLIPRKGEVTFQYGYLGLRDLAMRSGEYKNVFAHPVYENDDFGLEYISGEMHHRPALRDEGALLCFYAVAIEMDGTVDAELMTNSQVMKVRDRSSEAWKSGKTNPWQTDYDQMGRKTAFKRLCNRLKLSSEAARALAEEDAPLQATTSEPAVDLGKLPTIQAMPVLTHELPTETHPDREPIAEAVVKWWGGIPKFGQGSATKAEQKGLASERELHGHIEAGGRIDGMSTVAKLWLAAKFDEPNEEPNDEPVNASVDHVLVEFAEAIENARNAGIGPLDYVHAQIMESGEDIDGGLADDMMRHAAKGLGVSLASCTTEQMAEVLLKALA